MTEGDMPEPFLSILKLKDPDKIFDLICAYNYFAGRFSGNIPVDESRIVFERIKKLLKARTQKEK